MRLNDDVAENRRLTRWAELLPRAPGQVGDVHETDAELVPLGDGRLLALTVDTVAEEIALGLYREPETAGRIAVTAALSDLAAVGADPIGLLLSVTLPARDAESVQESVARGVAEAARDAGTWVLGGDTNEGATLCVELQRGGPRPRRVAAHADRARGPASAFSPRGPSDSARRSPLPPSSETPRFFPNPASGRRAVSPRAARCGASPVRRWTRATASSRRSTSSRA